MSLSWIEFSRRPHIRKLSLNEQQRLYNIELNRLTRLRQWQQMLIKENMIDFDLSDGVDGGGPGGDEPADTPEVEIVSEADDVLITESGDSLITE